MRNLLISLVTAGLLVTGASAQELSYSLLESASAQPSPRFDGAIAYDAVGRRVLLFGGQDTVPRNDLWEYSLEQHAWTEIRVSGSLPPARFGHTAVFDPVRRRLIIFGGQAGTFFSDVWAFEIASGSWQQLSPDDAGPSRRYGHSAIYATARDRMVISHGFTDAGRFDDTWAFDFARNTWQDISPSGVRPLRRCLHHAAYDADHGQMYLYGGCSSGFGPCPQGDLWSFDLTLNRWTERTPNSSPPPREHYGMAFDAARGKLVVFGGNGTGLLNDTWEYDPPSGAWRQPALAGTTPGPRQRHEAVYAADQGAVLFFGGTTAAGLTNELWRVAPVTLGDGPAVFAGGIVNAFSGQGGAVAPGEVVSIYGRGLGPMTGVALPLDQTGRLPTMGPGVSVTCNGIAAPIFFAQSDQLNIQVPYELAGSPEAALIVTVNGRSSEIVTVPVKATQPGLFPRVWNQDGTINSPDNPAAAGTVIVLYATGQGVTSPPSPTGFIPGGIYPEPAAPAALRTGGVEAPIEFKGQAPGTVGVAQINARLTNVQGPAVPVVLSVGAGNTQAGVSVAIR
jgi:uncharacterized protein (TIGR03437 family)